MAKKSVAKKSVAKKTKKHPNPVKNLNVDETARRVRLLAEKKVFTKWELNQIKDGIADFFGLLLVFNEAIHEAEILEPNPKTKKKSGISLQGLCKDYLGSSTKANPLDIPLSQMEVELLLYRLVEEGIAKPIPSYNHELVLPEWRLKKRARYYVSRHLHNVKNFTKYWGVSVKKPGDGVPPVLLLMGREPSMSGGHRLLVYHVASEPEDTDKVSEWIHQMRVKFSPFRGNICMWDASGLDFNERPRGLKWDEIVVEEPLREEFMKCLHMMQNPESYRENSLPVKRGLVLAGPPGVGKTVHLECLVTEVCAAKLPVFQISNRINPSSLSEIYELAEEVGPALVVLEDIDTVTAKRTDDMYDTYGHSGNVGMLNALLTVLDGTEQRDGVITVATTNHPQALDRALASRPGRFDRTFSFGYPKPESRLKIMELHINQRKLDLDPEAILEEAASSEREEDYSWILNEEGVTPSHLAEAVDSVARDLTRDKQADPAESFLAAIKGLRSSINVDERFVEKKPTSVGFGT